MTGGIPGTYQEWMECLQKFQTEPVYLEELRSLDAGRMERGTYPEDKFQMRVVETVDIMLRKSVKRFSRILNEIMEAGDLEQIPVLCIRLGREMQKCYFYRYIVFLEQTFMDRLDAELNGQISRFWEQELEEIRKLCEETEDPGVEEIYFAMKRIRRQTGK